MKSKLFVLVLALAIMVPLTHEAQGAGPYLVCEPQAGVTHYKLTGPAWMPAQAEMQAGFVKNEKYYAADPGSGTPVHMILDVSPALVGITNTTIAACKASAQWGEQCSSTTPFTFERPAPPNPLAGARLVQ